MYRPPFTPLNARFEIPYLKDTTLLANMQERIRMYVLFFVNKIVEKM